MSEKLLPVVCLSWARSKINQWEVQNSILLCTLHKVLRQNVYSFLSCWTLHHVLSSHSLQLCLSYTGCVLWVLHLAAAAAAAAGNNAMTTVRPRTEWNHTVRWSFFAGSLPIIIGNWGHDFLSTLCFTSFCNSMQTLNHFFLWPSWKT